jgi:hypothetical protein
VARIETVLQATMPTGYNAYGKYQVLTSYQAATNPEAELSEEQSQRGRALAKYLRERVEKQLRRAGWSEVISLSGEQTVLGKNGLTLWEYHGPPPRVSNDQQIVNRRIKKRAVTFHCKVCGTTVTQQRFPSHLPKYCSDACKDSLKNRDATREETRQRVAAWRKAHPNARRKQDETSS